MPELTHDEVAEMAGAYVLGALEPVEAAAVEAHLISCSLSHDEIAELGSVLPVLAESAPVVEPPAGLKARIMAAAAAEAAVASSAPASVASSIVAPVASSIVAPVASSIPAPVAEREIAGAPAPTPFPTASERNARRSGRANVVSWVLRIAAAVAIVGLLGSNLLLRGQLDAAQSYEQAVAAVTQVASQPGALTAVLSADSDTGTGLAAVSASGEVTIAMQDLAPTTGATVYTAWVIVGDDPSVAIGSFQVGSGRTGTFTASGLPTTPGLVLALTREPASGATKPTLPIISKGVATSAG